MQTDTPDWSSISAPLDDGGADHLPGAVIPPLTLAASDGSQVDIAALRGRTILYAYPRTGVPGVENPAGWDLIPGARGCSPQSCAFRDHFAELREAGVAQVFGVSTQDNAYQKEAAERLALPFPLLSDAKLELANAFRLPTFETSGMTLLKRCTLVIDDAIVTHVFYPVFPPDGNAAIVLAWLRRDAQRKVS